MVYNKTELEDLYINQQLSWIEIAKKFNTYPNKVRRDAVKLGIKSRDKSEAQSVAISSDRHPHPTKGKERSDETKLQISKKMADIWDNLSDEEKIKRSEQGKEQWDKKSAIDKKLFHQAAIVAIRKSAVEGSKLEKHLHEELIKAGYHVEYHKKRLILNENLHLDMFLPKINVAIEVDGTSHYNPVWGHKTLLRNKKSDSEKAGLLLAKGLVFIRIRATKVISERYKRDILQELLTVLTNIQANYPPQGKRYITLGDKI